jgi:hypothetical protein
VTHDKEFPRASPFLTSKIQRELAAEGKTTKRSPETDAEPIESEAKAAKNGKAEESKKSDDTQAQQLTKISTAAGLFHTPNDTGYADVSINGHRETWAIRSKAFKQWLVREFYQRDGAVPSATAIQAALLLIEAKAKYDGPERQVFVRVGSHAGRQYLDLADAGWNAIEIDEDGWRLEAEPPLRFRRAAGILALPIPERGGKIDKLRPFLNVKADDDFVLAVAWLLAALRDRGPYPVLALLGVRGAAKSTFTAILRALTDPNTAPLRALPRDDRDLFIAANNSHVIAFDNVSGLRPWLSDTLCRLACGGGFAVRQLYTDNDEVLFDSCRPIIINGIEDFVTRTDLADRSIFSTLQEIQENKRKEEQKLWAEFEKERPKILGALLTAVSFGLKQLPHVKLARLPRMADFAKWATACEPALWKSGTFIAAYDANRMEAIETVIEADPVATGLREFMTVRTEWAGTASELLNSLSLVVSEPERRGKAWPTAPNKLSGRLRRQKTFLRQIGIEIDEHREGKARTRKLHIKRREEVGKQPSAPSASSASEDSTLSDNDLEADDQADDKSESDLTVRPTVRTNPLKTQAADDRTIADDKSPTSSPLCAHCGGPGGSPVAYDGRQAFVHPHCRNAWRAAQDGVFNQRLRLVAGSSQ